MQGAASWQLVSCTLHQIKRKNFVLNAIYLFWLKLGLFLFHISIMCNWWTNFSRTLTQVRWLSFPCIILLINQRTWPFLNYSIHESCIKNMRSQFFLNFQFVCTTCTIALVHTVHTCDNIFIKKINKKQNFFELFFISITMTSWHAVVCCMIHVIPVGVKQLIIGKTFSWFHGVGEITKTQKAK